MIDDPAADRGELFGRLAVDAGEQAFGWQFLLVDAVMAFHAPIDEQGRELCVRGSDCAVPALP